VGNQRDRSFILEIECRRSLRIIYDGQFDGIWERLAVATFRHVHVREVRATEADFDAPIMIDYFTLVNEPY
jgi:hypothetical protein